MNPSKHYGARLSQRGITSAMADLVLRYGEIRQDKYVITKKMAQKLIAEFKKVVSYWDRIQKFNPESMNNIQIDILNETREEIKILLKIADTDGVAIVESNNTLITAYKLH